jgi:hypothetical protein
MTTTKIPNLSTIPKGQNWQGSIEKIKIVDKEGQPAVEFAEVGVDAVWLKDFEFTNGMIEFDARGKSDPPQNGFLGIAFRIQNMQNLDAVYFRAFNFRAEDPVRKSHAVQYISSPKWPWERLRKEKSGQFEKPIESPPDGDEWFHAKIVVEGRVVKVFVNDAQEPSLTVPELSDRSGGSVGLWCYGYGVIANLNITPAA